MEIELAELDFEKCYRTKTDLYNKSCKKQEKVKNWEEERVGGRVCRLQKIQTYQPIAKYGSYFGSQFKYTPKILSKITEEM